MRHDLTGRIVVVTGATGVVGHGAARAFLDHGATVVLPSRDERRASRACDELGDRQGRVLTLVGDLSDEAEAFRLRDAALARFGRIDHVVASLGGVERHGPLLEQDVATWRRAIAASLDSQFLTARAFLPQVRPGGSYTLVTGVAGERTYPRAGLLTVASAGVHALARVLRKEAEEGAVRVDEVRIGCRVEREARPGTLPARRLGDVLVALAAEATAGGLVRVDREGDVVAILAGGTVRAGT